MGARKGVEFYFFKALEITTSINCEDGESFSFFIIWTLDLLFYTWLRIFFNELMKINLPSSVFQELFLFGLVLPIVFWFLHCSTVGFWTFLTFAFDSCVDRPLK